MYKSAKIRLLLPNVTESGFGIVPTSSTTTQLSLGDALSKESSIENFYFCGRSSLKDFSYCKLHLLYAYQPKGKKEDMNDKDEVPELLEKKIQSA